MQSWPKMDIFNEAQWQIAYRISTLYRVFCTLSIQETAGSDISRARYTESALVACLHSIQSSVAWIDRLVLVPAQRARACPTCSFHVPAKNPHRKGHFAKQLCLCTLSTPPPPVPRNTERSVMISTEPQKRRRQNLSDKHTNLHYWVWTQKGLFSVRVRVHCTYNTRSHIRKKEMKLKCIFKDQA